MYPNCVKQIFFYSDAKPYKTLGYMLNDLIERIEVYQSEKERTESTIRLSKSTIAYSVSCLLTFGGNVKVLEPQDAAEALQAAAKNILSRYN
jgi:predicted DNA-binding transcriptional regulator YafY